MPSQSSNNIHNQYQSNNNNNYNNSGPSSDGLLSMEKGHAAAAAAAATTSITNVTTTTSVQHHDEHEEDGVFFWHFADWGNTLPQTSRDGSIHATDEVFNSISHLAAFIISVLGCVLLITKSCTTSQTASSMTWKIISFSVYGLSLCNLFLCSTIHHSITTTKRLELLFQLLDYLAIFPLIAGTFTPLCLVFLHSTVIGWTFLSVVWTLSILSMIGLSYHFQKIPKWMTMTLYITLGWFGAFLGLYLYPQYMNLGGMFLLVLGGIWYTIGGYIYTTEQPSSDQLVPGKFGFHELWHIFVIAGATTHWLLMYYYVLPYNG